KRLVGRLQTLHLRAQGVQLHFHIRGGRGGDRGRRRRRWIKSRGFWRGRGGTRIRRRRRWINSRVCRRGRRGWRRLVFGDGRKLRRKTVDFFREIIQP